MPCNLIHWSQCRHTQYNLSSDFHASYMIDINFNAENKKCCKYITLIYSQIFDLCAQNLVSIFLFSWLFWIIDFTKHPQPIYIQFIPVKSSHVIIFRMVNISTICNLINLPVFNRLQNNIYHTPIKHIYMYWLVKFKRGTMWLNTKSTCLEDLEFINAWIVDGQMDKKSIGQV